MESISSEKQVRRGRSWKTEDKAMGEILQIRGNNWKEAKIFAKIRNSTSLCTTKDLKATPVNYTQQCTLDEAIACFFFNFNNIIIQNYFKYTSLIVKDTVRYQISCMFAKTADTHCFCMTRYWYC